MRRCEMFWQVGKISGRGAGRWIYEKWIEMGNPGLVLNLWVGLGLGGVQVKGKGKCECDEDPRLFWRYSSDGTARYRERGRVQ
jgi:hypothetical protein